MSSTYSSSVWSRIFQRRGTIKIRPITQRAANEFINAHHRHHKAPRGWKLGISLRDEGGDVIGVAILGRPVARMLDDELTVEVTRLCSDGTENACSKLYGAARRIAFEMGYERIITYILKSEPGTSLRAAGWEMVAEVKGRSWDTPSRRRVDKHPTVDKARWEARRKKT